MDDRRTLENELCALLANIAGGDRESFTRLYALTAPKFNAITIKMVRNPDLAADILQRAYLSIWKKAGTFDPDKGKAFTWMLVIMRNRSIDVIRERKRRGYAEEIDETMADETMNTDIEAKGFFLRRMIRPHLNGLPVHTTQAIILQVVHGLTSREIGERMGIPTHTAKSRIRRGLETLRRDMDADSLAALL